MKISSLIMVLSLLLAMPGAHAADQAYQQNGKTYYPDAAAEKLRRYNEEKAAAQAKKPVVALNAADKQAADAAASGEGSKGAGLCNGLTVGGKNLDAAHPKRIKKLERWCGKDGKSGGSLRKELAQLKQKFTTNSCSDLTNGGKGMTGLKASNLDVKGMIAKAEKRLDETCGAYQKYLSGAADLCKQYGAAGAGIKANGANGVGDNQQALCAAGKMSATSATSLAGLEQKATALGKQARDVKGLKSYDDAEMKRNMEDLEVYTKMTMTALNRQANLKKAERAQEAATSAGDGGAIGFARSSDVKAFFKRMEACQEAVKTVKPFLKNYKELASDLNYFPLEADQMVNDFGEQRKAHGTQASELAARSNKLGASGGKGTCEVNVPAAAKAESGISQAKKEEGAAASGASAAGESKTPAGAAVEKASAGTATEEPRTAEEKAAAQKVAGGKGDRAKPGSLEASAEEYRKQNGKAASSGEVGAGASAVGSVLNMDGDKNVTTIEKTKPGMTNKDINDTWSAGPTTADTRARAQSLENSSAKTYGDVKDGSFESLGTPSMGAPAPAAASAPVSSGSARAPASIAQPVSMPITTAENFPEFDQAAYRAGRENLRLSPIQAGESNNAYAQRVVGARPAGSPITISNGTTWQPYTGGKLDNRRMLLPVQK